MGGKGGGYSGPSATEIEQQKQLYRQQWDYDAQQKKLAEEQGNKKRDDEAAKKELIGRRGAGDVSVDQVGYKRKITPEDEVSFTDVIK